jgi:hypothetical protein
MTGEKVTVTAADILALDSLKQAKLQAYTATRTLPEYQAGIAATACAWALVAIAEQLKQRPEEPKKTALLSLRERIRLAWRILREGR